MDERHFLTKGFPEVLDNAQENPSKFKQWQYTLEKSLYIHEEHEEFLEEDSHVETELDLEKRPFEVTPLPDADDVVPIVATDASAIPLGETDKGIIAAVRTTVVKVENSRMKTEVFGPYLLHTTPATFDPIYNALCKALGLGKRRPPPLYKAVNRVMVFLERVAQRYANKQIRDGIILWDGSLTISRTTPKGVFTESFRQAKERGNSIVAISKRSRLRLRDGTPLIDLLVDEQDPCYCRIPFMDVAIRHRRFLLGELFVVKFTSTGFPFRVDVKPASGNAVEVLAKLRKSSSFRWGYPEPLVIAHAHSYFTSAEALSLQMLAVKRYGLSTIPSFDLRTYILGPFGGMPI